MPAHEAAGGELPPIVKNGQEAKTFKIDNNYFSNYTLVDSQLNVFLGKSRWRNISCNRTFRISLFLYNCNRYNYFDHKNYKITRLEKRKELFDNCIDPFRFDSFKYEAITGK